MLNGMTTRRSNRATSMSKSAMQDWNIEASQMSLRTENPIRQIVDSMRSGNANSSKKFLSLSIGDPTVFGNLPRAAEITDSVVKATLEMKYEGYPPATGYEFARKAVADYFNVQMEILRDPLMSGNSEKLSPDDVMLTSGCSHALEIAMSTLCDAGDNILISKPCFPLYKTIAQSFGFEARYYKLDVIYD
jgi:tyrosine aminotransferase